MNKYKQTLGQLQAKASMHWSKDMLDAAGAHSALPILLETQEEFIALLTIASKSPLSWRNVLMESTSLTPSIFLKHLMVLSDLGGEALNKLTPMSQYFSRNTISFEFNEQLTEYQFREIGEQCSLTNSALKVDAKSVVKNSDFTDRMFDVVMLLMFGSLDPNNQLPQDVQEKCSIGALLGNAEEIDSYVKQNYIKVSKQLSGEKANSLGHASQRYVYTLLQQELPPEWIVKEESTLSNVRHTDEGGNLTNFDLVVISPSKKEFGIEVSFQVTTNSTIERKAREAKSAHEKASKVGHKICYVIDGAGNLNVRKKAITTICENSDCTVAMTSAEIKFLADFMMDTELN
ncbi:hypothetical protein [Vibrio splendidus]|uniref:hypothetical protein n=1 Tax=Vibrio splendidus TaxID=29497 RepID=UPI0021B3A337|nr:hypothetical protein [Vibrio splendidus]UWZ97424.1 hypothetical protein IM698_13760 [Vibrio splendidus]